MANLDIDKPKRTRTKKTKTVSAPDMPMIQEGMDITDDNVIKTYIVNTSFVQLEPLKSYHYEQELKLTKEQADSFKLYLDEVRAGK